MEKLSESQINKNLEALHGWSFSNGYLTKSFQFSDFKEAFAAMTHIAFECELQGHHPNWENVYNSLTIKLNTHDADGITEKDFSLAKSIDAIIKS